MHNALYIHVPFCAARCAYCDFYALPGCDTGLMARYVTALRREAQMRGGGSVSSVFIGGGTPSVLPPGSIKVMLECAAEHTHITEGAEVTLEANPESLTPVLINEAMSAGVSRLSLGVQSLHDSELVTLGRPHTAKAALDAIKTARRHQGLELSLDLMYSIPGQSAQTWSDTLTRAMDTGVGHVSAYELTLEPTTPLMDAVSSGRLSMPTEDEALEMYDTARKMLTASGYEHYEVSNYALPGKRCLHNINYWRRGGYLGLGPGAVSFDGTVRTLNLPDLMGYIGALEAGKLPPRSTETPTPAEAAREFLLLGMRQTKGISIKEAAETYDIRNLLEAAGGYIDDGLMESQGGQLSMSPRGMPLMNSILVTLFDRLGL